MNKQTEVLKLALEALSPWVGEDANHTEQYAAYHAIREALAEQPAQQQEPVAYDKTEINCFAQDLYDQKMREGKRGHYESMFHVIHQCIKKVSPPASKPWVGLSTDEIYDMYNEPRSDAEMVEFARAIEAKLREKNA